MMTEKKNNDDEKINNYQKYKHTILKWRVENPEKYILSQLKHQKKIMNDPEKKKLFYEKLKINKNKRDELNNIIKKAVGRPRKYNINII
jgi:hypothetical protein